MTSFIRSLVTRPSGLRATSGQPLPFDEWIGYFNFGNFPMILGQPLGGKEEEITHAYSSLTHAMRTNGVVFACELVRVMLFSEARFVFRQRRSGRTGDLFGTPALRILERPDGPGSTTASMLKRAMLHADFGGTGFLVERRGRIVQPRPDWMTVVLGSENDPEITGDSLDAEVIGYLYHEGGRYSGGKVTSLLPEQVATFVPFPDPMARVRGIPWVSAVTRNVMGHNAATTHKLKFFENGATPQMIVSLDAGITDPVKFRQWVEVLEQDHKGSTNAYKTLYLGAGATATVVGKDLKELDFKATQGADETLIAAAAGVGSVVAQLSEGLQGSALNAGNFAQAMRRDADLTFRPLWRDMAGSLEVFAPPADDAELWYDDSDIPALKDDIKDAAEVQAKEAQAIRTLLDAGWVPESVKDAVIANDWKRLEHSGLFSVQLQPPGSEPAAETPALQLAALSRLLQLTATKPDLPLLAATFEARCTGTRKDGTPCNAMLGKRPTAEPIGFETKCHQCGTVVAA